MYRITQGKIDPVEDVEAARSIVRDVLLSYKNLHRGAGHTFRYKTVDEVLQNLEDTCTIVLIENEYLLIFQQIDCQFSHDRVLDEVLLSRYRKGTHGLDYVVGCMENMGRKLGCNKLQLSTLGQRGEALPKLYARYGFTEACRIMTKEIPDG